MNKRTLEKELELNGRCVIQTVGVSMEPLLHNRKSTVVIEKAKFPLKKYDVVLFHRPTGEYVLHRIIKAAGDVYIIRGDNCIEKESVPEDWIIGVMTGYFENEDNVYISCDSRRYRRYLITLRWRRWRRWQRRQIRRIIKVPGKLASVYEFFLKEK